jgi:hypothetical protein
MFVRLEKLVVWLGLFAGKPVSLPQWISFERTICERLQLTVGDSMLLGKP